MTTQIKNSLISRIKNSNDLDFLKALQTIFDLSEKSLYQLSTEQHDSIQKGREEIKNRDYIENDQLMSEMKKMADKRIIWSTRASRELKQIIDYINQRNKAVAIV